MEMGMGVVWMWSDEEEWNGWKMKMVEKIKEVIPIVYANESCACFAPLVRLY